MRLGGKVFFTLLREDAQAGILRFMVEMFAYKWLLLVIGEINKLV